MNPLFGKEVGTRSDGPRQLLYGDNLTIMRNMKSESVDLIYLDPPFNSQRSYNLIYKQATGLPVPEQEEAFCDAWEMDAEKEAMARDMPIMLQQNGVDDGLVSFWQAWIKALRNTQPRLLAYLVYMSYRLYEMRRILRSSGSLYLHCDATASHYIKVILDAVFGHQNFRNEIIWKRTGSHGDATRRFASTSDTILFYSKTSKYTFNRRFLPYSEDYLKTKYRFTDADGRRYRLSDLRSPNPRPNLTYDYKGYKPHPNGWAVSLERMKELDEAGKLRFPAKPDGRIEAKRYLDEVGGQPVDNVWTDIAPVNSRATDRLGYPTQKPLSLLQRIIESSTNPGDTVFDPFAGCGTTICASHLTGRRWIGCDIAILSVRIVRDVLLKRYGLQEGREYEIDGVPLSVEGARELFEHDPRQFQHWAVELAGGFCNSKHSGDKGIDGRIYFETQGGLQNMVISVKGGAVMPAFVRELRGTLAREASGQGDDTTQLAGFISLTKPTKGMRQEAAIAGQYTYQGVAYDRLQIRSVEDLLEGRVFDTPSRVRTMNWQKQMVLPLSALVTSAPKIAHQENALAVAPAPHQKKPRKPKTSAVAVSQDA